MSEGILFLMVLLWVAVAVAIASHADNNGKTPLWGVAVGLTGLIGLIIYAISLASDSGGNSG